MKLSVRKASISELDLLMEWRMRVLDEVFSEEYASLSTDEREASKETIYKNNIDYYREHIADNTHTACFAFDEEAGTIIGCGGICYQKEMPSPDNLTGTSGYLMNIYTATDFRGEGVGRKIVEFLIEDA